MSTQAEFESAILGYLRTNPPTSKRRTWWNVARGIGAPKDERVIEALDNLVKGCCVFKQSVGKGHRYALTASYLALRL